MAHSLELLLDDETETWVARVWAQLAGEGLPSQALIRAATNRPHITIIAAQHISTDVDEHLGDVADLLPVPVKLGAPLIFGGKRATVALSVTPSASLLATHSVCTHKAQPFTDNQFDHTRPGDWTPHVTLACRVPPDQLADVLAVCGYLGPDVKRAPMRDASATTLRRWDSDTRTDTLYT